MKTRFCYLVFFALFSCVFSWKLQADSTQNSQTPTLHSTLAVVNTPCSPFGLRGITQQGEQLSCVDGLWSGASFVYGGHTIVTAPGPINDALYGFSATFPANSDMWVSPDSELARSLDGSLANGILLEDGKTNAVTACPQGFKQGRIPLSDAIALRDYDQSIAACDKQSHTKVVMATSNNPSSGFSTDLSGGDTRLQSQAKQGRGVGETCYKNAKPYTHTTTQHINIHYLDYCYR